MIFFTTLAIYLFARTAPVARFPPAAHQQREPITIEPTWKNFALAYAAMGVAVLVKGPVGVVLPTAVFGLFLLATRGANTLPDCRPSRPDKAAGAGWPAAR